MKKGNIYFILFLIFITFIVYYKAIYSDYVFDDVSYIRDAPIFNTKGVNIKQVLKTGFDGGQFKNNKDSMYYRPIVTLSFYLEKRTIGFSSETLHLANIIFYILSIILIYLFLLKQGLKKYTAEYIILLFSLVPLNTDNVVWIVGRYDLFLIIFGISVLLVFDKAILQKNKFYLIISSVLFLFGMFSKETFIIWFVFLIVYEYFKRGKINILYHSINFSIVLFFFYIKHFILSFGSLTYNKGYPIFYYLKILIFTIGNYFKILFFPFLIPKFYFINDIFTVKNFIFFILFVGFILLVIKLAFKNKKLLIPLSLFLISFPPYILLAYSNLWPFKISIRYMMIPFLAFVWMIFILLEKYGNKFKGSVIFIILIFYILFNVQEIKAYKNELSFWKDAYVYHTNNSYITYNLAEAYYNNNNFLDAQYYLKESLNYPMKKMTAYYIALLNGYMDLEKADYDDIDKWINNLKKLEKLFYIPDYEKIKKYFLLSDLYINKGKFETAEKILTEAKKKDPYKLLIYEKLYNLYSGNNEWEKARNIEKEIKNRFPYYSALNTRKRERKFNSMSEKQKIVFYFLNKNYKKVSDEIVKNKDKIGKTDYFILLESYERLDRQNKVKEMISDYLKKYPTYQSYNELGFFYLKRLYRVKIAINYFKKSLQTNPRQNKIKALINYLSKTYNI